MSRGVRRALSAAALVFGCVACGGTHVASTARGSLVDACLVGRWTATSVSGSIIVSGAAVSLSGGGGEVLTIAASGALVTDESHAQPLTGTAPDGTVYRLVQSGKGAGTITSGANRIGVSLGDPAALTISLYRNGSLLQRTHPAAATDTYTCRAHSALVIAGATGTVTTYTAS